MANEILTPYPTSRWTTLGADAIPTWIRWLMELGSPDDWWKPNVWAGRPKVMDG